MKSKKEKKLEEVPKAASKEAAQEVTVTEPPKETKPSLKGKESKSKQNEINFEDLKGYNIDKCDLKATSSLKIIPSRVVNCTPRPFSGPSSFEPSPSTLSPMSTAPQPLSACPSPAFLQAPSPAPLQQASSTKAPASASAPAQHAVYETIEEPHLKPAAKPKEPLKESSPLKE